MATIRNYRVAPGDGALNPITIPGTTRTYSAVVGSFALVPIFDWQTLGNAGWVTLHGRNNRGGDVGTTAQRPSQTIDPVPAGFQYIDTTLGALIVALGPKSGWANAITGAIV